MPSVDAHDIQDGLADLGGKLRSFGCGQSLEIGRAVNALQALVMLSQMVFSLWVSAAPGSARLPQLAKYPLSFREILQLVQILAQLGPRTHQCA